MQPSPLAMTHAVGTGPTRASEHGLRRGVGPFASVGGMPCDIHQERGQTPTLF